MAEPPSVVPIPTIFAAPAGCPGCSHIPTTAAGWDRKRVWCSTAREHYRLYCEAQEALETAAKFRAERSAPSP